MTRRRNFSAKHKIHPTQVTTWKRQAIDGLMGVFSDKAKKIEDHEAETTFGAAISHMFRCDAGFLYLVAIMDWATRKVLAWWLSNNETLSAIGPRTMVEWTPAFVSRL